MGKTPLYEEIVEWVRREIHDGNLRPSSPLPTIRAMADRWACTPGTVQAAYRELARQGLVVSRPGQGTRVGARSPGAFSGAPPSVPGSQIPMRRAALAHQAEAFLLEALTADYTPAEVEAAVRTVLDRWRSLRSLAETQPNPPAHILRFAGSHDPAISLLAAHFAELAGDCALSVAFTGSLGGLIALAEGQADVAGCHLWDEETDTYNVPFIRRLLPGRKVAILTLAHRRLGLIVPPGNPENITCLKDLARDGVRFINRQPGAGTRVWLDVQLRRLGVAPSRIAGYGTQATTHSEVGRAIAAGQANAGLGVEAAALAYGLTFIPLTTERYDLAIPAEAWQAPSMQILARWLATGEARELIHGLGGYDTRHTGTLTWVGE